MLKTTVMLSTICMLAGDAHAEARSFFAPENEGFRLSACLDNGTSCGKPVADAFCQREGFSEAILFQREVVAEARVIDQGSVCTGGACESFRQIKCYLPPASDQAWMQAQ